MKFQIKHILLISMFMIFLVNSNQNEISEDNDIDSNGLNIRTQHRKNHRHHKRLRNRQNRRMQRRFRTTHAPFFNYEDYDIRNEKITFNVTAKVGESVILHCAINSSYGSNPGVIWMQGKLGNVLTLNTNRITADRRFEIIQSPLLQTNQVIHSERSINYIKRNNEKSNFDLNYYHLKINNVQSYDENEYSCETTIAQQVYDRPNLQSLVYLKVTQSPGFIERMTSQSNMVVTEDSDVNLKCHAFGKPKPRISWNKIDENGYTTNLKHRGTRLTIRNISKADLSKYECVADNGILPSISKKFSLNVNFAPVVVPIKHVVYQKLGESVLIGCRVNSNPESRVKWFKKAKTANKSLKDQYDEINFTNHPQYTNLNFKHTNQTVTYFKIKSLDIMDYTQFKCVATNSIGTSESVIKIMDRSLIKTSELRNNKNLPDIVTGVESDPSYYDLYDEDYINDKTYQMMNNFRDHENRTFYKYSINKSNRLVKNEDSLQRINDLGGNSANTVKIFSIQPIIISIFYTFFIHS